VPQGLRGARQFPRVASEAVGIQYTLKCTCWLYDRSWEKYIRACPPTYSSERNCRFPSANVARSAPSRS